MKELLKLLAAYNLWANQKICDAILPLPGEQQLREVPSSFQTLSRTVLHMWDAESIWWQRMKLQEKIIIPSENFQGNMRDAVTGLLQQDQLWLDWINNASEPALEHVFHYHTLKKEYFRQPVFQVAAHVFNHSTYHRGQLVNMLRQLGVDKIPQTDLAIWARGKK